MRSLDILRGNRGCGVMEFLGAGGVDKSGYKGDSSNSRARDHEQCPVECNTQ